MSVFDFDHLDKGEFTYFSHMRFASGLGLILLVLSLASLFHAFFPFLLPSFVSSKLDSLTKAIDER
jgi:hypothetical protein